MYDNMLIAFNINSYTIRLNYQIIYWNNKPLYLILILNIIKYIYNLFIGRYIIINILYSRK